MAKDDKPNQDQKLQIFPPGFSKLERPFRAVQERTNWLDNRVAELKREHPAPVGPEGLATPGGNKTTPSNAWLEIKKFELEKQNLSADYFKGLEVELVDVDRALKEEIRTIVKHQFSTNAFKAETREQLETQQKEVRPFDKGFDFMESLHFNKHTKPVVLGEDQLKLNGHDITSLNHSTDYLASLHHTKLDPPLSNEQKELADAIQLAAEYPNMDEPDLTGEDQALPSENGKDDIIPEFDEPEID